MVKGCQKKTIHVKDTGSRIFEEAYFVLRPGAAESGASENDMIGEAMRIAGESLPGGGKRRKWRAASLFTFIAGLLAGGGAAALLEVLVLH